MTDALKACHDTELKEVTEALKGAQREAKVARDLVAGLRRERDTVKDEVAEITIQAPANP